jgi:hypothetical protein
MRHRGTPIVPSARFSPTQSPRQLGWPAWENAPAIAPGAAESPRFLGIASTKEVPYRLLGLISRGRERAFHGQVWSVVEQAVRGEVRPFDFYFDFVCARAEELKPLWEMDSPLG